MAKPNLFATLHAARRQLKERGLESDSRFMTIEAMSMDDPLAAIIFIEAYLDMVLVPLPTAPSHMEE